MSGAGMSVNCSNPAQKNRKNRTLACHYLFSANKSIADILWRGRFELIFANIFIGIIYVKRIFDFS